MGVDQVETFCGQRIDEMSREELIAAVRTLGRMLLERDANILFLHRAKPSTNAARQECWKLEARRPTAAL